MDLDQFHAVTTVRVAKDMLGWDVDDPDLSRYLTGDEIVVLGEVPTCDYANIDDELDEYTAFISNGISPPIWAWESDGCLITGEHRLTAAHRLGLASYPAYIVKDLA